MQLITVQIHGNGAFFHEKQVMAKTIKDALLAVIESLPEKHAAWGAPGWQVQAYPTSRPVILN